MKFPKLQKGGAMPYKKKKPSIALPDAIAMNKFFAGKSPYSAQKGTKIKSKKMNKFKLLKKQQGGILTILNQKGGVQKEIVSGARVISIPETKKIIKQVYSVNKPTDDDYIKLGQTLVEVFNGQDNRPTEYVD